MFIEESQDAAERKEFAENVAQITQDSPRAQLASRRIRKSLGKIGGETAKAIRDILVKVATEAVKGSL